MIGNDILVTGTPRSGTTLTCHLLNKLPDTVALHEPMQTRKLAELPSDQGRVDAVVAFCAEQRRLVLNEGRAISKQVGGAVPDNPVLAERSTQGARQRLVSRGFIKIEKPLSPTFGLVVKHPSAFAAMLAPLASRFPVFAVIRNPLATLGSWSTVPFPVQDGHVGVGEGLDPTLSRRLADIPDVIDRQIALLDWFHQRFIDVLAPERILRYEDIVASRGSRLSVIQPSAAALDEPLVERDLLALYDRDHLLRIGGRLLAVNGAFWQTYRPDDVARLLDRISAQRPAAP